LVAMEPPNSLKAESIRDEKVKIVRALRRIDSQSVNEKVVRGQYINGWIRGTAVPGYLDEDGCEMDSSNTETYIAIKAHIDNWRWSGVPFYFGLGSGCPRKSLRLSFSTRACHIISSATAPISLTSWLSACSPMRASSSAWSPRNKASKNACRCNRIYWIWTSGKAAIWTASRMRTSDSSSMPYKVISPSSSEEKKLRKAGVGAMSLSPPVKTRMYLLCLTRLAHGDLPKQRY